MADALSLIVGIIVVTIVLYIVIRLIADKRDFDTPYVFRLVAVSIITVIIVPALQSISDRMFIPELGPVIGFMAILYSIKLLVLPSVIVPSSGGLRSLFKGEWPAAIWCTFLSMMLIYLITAGFEAAGWSGLVEI